MAWGGVEVGFATKIDSRLDPITAVVVMFNSAHCLPALAASLGAFRHIIVVDNASEDNITATLQAVLPQAVLLQQSQNIGFGAANNVAFRAIAAQNQCSQVLLLNPDCTIDLESVLALSETLKASTSADSKIALVAPVIMNAAGELENKTHVFAPNQGSRKMDFLTGACWLGRIEVLTQVGGFDERIFLYYEDTDLCKRLRLAGYDLMLLAGAKAVHASRTSVKMRSDFDSGYLRGFHHTDRKSVV